MVELKNLSISVEDAQIISNFSVNFKPGAVTAVMGPNGSGKSTLAQTIMGHPSYTVTGGHIFFDGVDITQSPVHHRAQRGIFLSLQQPMAIPGVTVSTFLKEAFRAIYPTEDMTVYQFRLAQGLRCLDLSPDFLYRNLHDGFSGGEKKKCEMLQLLVLQPKVAILDEIDSGLDVDALARVGKGLQAFKKICPNSSIILITHYQRILKYIQPDQVHILVNGTLAESGTYELVESIESGGYDQFTKK